MPKKRKTVRVVALVQDLIEIEIHAESLQDGLDTASKLSADSFVTAKGEVIDSAFRIVQVGSDWPSLDD